MVQDDITISVNELKLLRMMAYGLTQNEMAGMLKLRPDTVRKYRVALIKKLNANNTTHAVAIAYERGWLKGTIQQTAA